MLRGKCRTALRNHKTPRRVRIQPSKIATSRFTTRIFAEVRYVIARATHYKTAPLSKQVYVRSLSVPKREACDD
jgi:hypothetical protein